MTFDKKIWIFFENLEFLYNFALGIVGRMANLHINYENAEFLHEKKPEYFRS